MTAQEPVWKRGLGVLAGGLFVIAFFGGLGLVWYGESHAQDEHDNGPAMASAFGVSLWYGVEGLFFHKAPEVRFCEAAAACLAPSERPPDFVRNCIVKHQGLLMASDVPNARMLRRAFSTLADVPCAKWPEEMDRLSRIPVPPAVP